MCKRVIQGIIFIGFSLQIALGLVWMCCNMAGVQEFPEPAGGIYWGITKGLSGGAYPAVYVLQLLAAGFAGWRLVWKLCGGSRIFALWGSLALLTLPMAMQCHMALLPYSLVCSAGLLQLSFCCELFRGAGAFPRGRLLDGPVVYEGLSPLGRRDFLSMGPLAGVLGCYLAQALLLPEYLYLGAVPLLAVFWLCRRGMTKRMKVLLLFAAAAAATVGIYSAGQRAVEAERTNDISGLEWTAVKRICWPTLWVDSDGMPDRLREVTDAVFWECTYYPGNMDREFKPAVEAALDAGEAKALLAEMAAIAWEKHYTMVIRQVGWDVLGYCVTPVVLQLQLSGDAYESYSGRNYEIMRSRAPVLTKRYINYGSWWFVMAAVLTVLLLVVRLTTGDRPYGRREGRLLLTALLFGVCSVCWYTVQGAGIMDYKYTVLINELWLLWSLKTMEGINRDEGERRQA